MAQKKKATTKKKRPTKKQKQAQQQTVCFWTGIVLAFFSFCVIFKGSFLGNICAHIVRIAVGNTYWLFGILLMAYAIYLIFMQKPIKIRQWHLWTGGTLIYIGILILMEAWFLHAYTPEIRLHAVEKTWNMLQLDFKNWQVEDSVGGGLVGALFYQAVYFLLSQWGAYTVGVLCCVFGLLQCLDIKLIWIMDKVQHFGCELVDAVAEAKDRNDVKRAERQQERQQQVRESYEEVSMPEPEPEPYVPEEPMEPVYESSMEPVVPPNPIPESEPLEPMTFTTEADADYQLPPLSLLKSMQPTDQRSEHRNVEKKKRILAQTFDSFGVDAKVEDYHIGPAITKFEIKLAVGVKVSKIVNLADDLALALAAKDVRIEAPIPGKSLIGIEVPNQAVGTVSFREVVEAQPKKHSLLEVPLGKDISGKVMTADLTKMPHLLIAGSTGSGKSVCINGIITSILMQAKPNEVKMMMIDPKMVELSVYNGIPHLLTPVVTNPRKASQALNKVVEEMERRYEQFAKLGVRNITGYNQHILATGESAPTMPYIVVIVDELADLMMVASKEVEDAITRLAQKARAAGIHMILATQRPSVDVITGLIKANVPSRIAFAVSSGTDSRTILDSNGAEKLLGRGDMLFIPIGESKPVRVQGAFISDEEVEKVVNFITEQRGPEYQEEMTPTEEPESSNGDSAPAHFDEAVEIVRREQKASASMIQRRLHVGYNAAANIIEEMENRGMVGPANGSKPREVYIAPEEEKPQA